MDRWPAASRRSALCPGPRTTPDRETRLRRAWTDHSWVLIDLHRSMHIAFSWGFGIGAVGFVFWDGATKKRKAMYMLSSASKVSGTVSITCIIEGLALFAASLGYSSGPLRGPSFLEYTRTGPPESACIICALLSSHLLLKPTQLIASRMDPTQDRRDVTIPNPGRFRKPNAQIRTAVKISYLGRPTLYLFC